MTTHQDKVNHFMQEILGGRTLEQVVSRLAPKPEPLTSVPRSPKITSANVNERWNELSLNPDSKPELLDAFTQEHMDAYQKNIENFIGTVNMPVGIAGPLKVNGIHAQGVFYVPLATTEAALVASYSRGSHLISLAGGCSAAVVAEGVTRSPGYAFATLGQAGMFTAWVLNTMTQIREAAESTSRFAKLLDLRVNIEGNHVYLLFDYSPGDAAGQNMVTIATHAAHHFILQNCPIKPKHAFVEANLSGDKKACAISFSTVRGKKVTAEVLLPKKLIEKVLHTTAPKMTEYWRMSALGGIQSGSIGIQGHFANGLAALYIACGQDAACVSESAVGVTRMESVGGDLYATVTMPNIIVGTVGGGTSLPTQRACLDILGLSGAGHARAFAELTAALCLGGELSIIGALTAGHFTHAHKSLARD